MTGWRRFFVSRASLARCHLPRALSVVAVLVLGVTAAVASDTRLVDGPVFVAPLSGVGKVSTILDPGPGRVMTGLSFGAAEDGVCLLELSHRAPDGPRADALRKELCRGTRATATAFDSRKTIRVPVGQAVTAVAVCLDRSGSRLEGIALSTLPDYCVADPKLWSERETGLPFRLRVQTKDGFLRPPYSYARPCTSGVVLRTLSDARPGCKAWQAKSACPSNHAVTGLIVATDQAHRGATAITGLAVRCQEIETDH